MEDRVVQKVEEELVVRRIGEHCEAMKKLQQSVEELRSRVGELETCFKTQDAFKIAEQFTGKAYVDTQGTRFCDILKRECMAVVKASYFDQQLREGKPFRDRANIDHAFFFTGEEVLDQWQKYGARFLVIISYSWLSKEQPDPDSFHLRTLVGVLDGVRAQNQEHIFSNSGPKELGVIIDFCSLWQKHHNGDTRSELQIMQFKEGLSEINTPYGHRDVLAIKLLAVPASEPRKYRDRGWTLFESCVIDGKGASRALGEKFPTCAGRNILVFEDDFPQGYISYGCFTQKAFGQQRLPCLTPARFEEALNQRADEAKQKDVALFTSGSDRSFVINKYKESFNELVTTDEIACVSLGWGPEEIEDFAEMLTYCKDLKVLIFSDSMIGDAGAEKIATALPSMASLQTLILFSNEIGAAGAEKIRTAALPGLHSIAV